MNEFWLIIGMAMVTFGVRYPVLAWFSRWPMPRPIFRALRFVAPTVLTAIIVPAVLHPGGGQLDVRPSNPYLLASVFALVIAIRSKNLLWTIISGMFFFWLWRFLTGLPALSWIP